MDVVMHTINIYHSLINNQPISLFVIKMKKRNKINLVYVSKREREREREREGKQSDIHLYTKGLDIRQRIVNNYKLKQEHKIN